MLPEGGALIHEFVDCTSDQGDSSPKRPKLSSANLNLELNLNGEELHVFKAMFHFFTSI